MDVMTKDDHAYLLMRSTTHADRAEACDDPATRALHQRFADAYARRAADAVVEDD
ncbi:MULTISPECIES: hypothetical protein [unclassified Sphingomonas]|jgi:hypothetical protein|uniref:hypothetical protein n=1 Tax=unclassified Sphingomonas TaxID=196159 RepID=UPI0013003B06|nr:MULTISPECIES: hypothetical protein [unclassified Sphingomonas]